MIWRLRMQRCSNWVSYLKQILLPTYAMSLHKAFRLKIYCKKKLKILICHRPLIITPSTRSQKRRQKWLWQWLLEIQMNGQKTCPAVAVKTIANLKYSKNNDLQLHLKAVKLAARLKELWINICRIYLINDWILVIMIIKQSYRLNCTKIATNN